MTGLRRRLLVSGALLALVLAWSPAGPVVAPAAAAPVATVPGTAATRSWSTPRQVSTANPAEFVAISCGAPRSCLAADQGGFYYRWNGRTWSLASRYGFPTSSFYEDYRVSSLSCPTATFCASVEMINSDPTPPFGSVVFWNGKHRTLQTIPDGFGATEVSCTSASSCVAVPDGISSGWAQWDGTSWQVHDPAFVDVRDLTCASATLCLASGIYDDTIVRFTGTSWVTEGALPPSRLSCASTALCLAIGSDGVTRQFTGSGWTVTATPPVDGSLSCARPTYCLDLGSTGYSVYDGSQWSAPVALPAPLSGRASCVRASFCAVAEGTQLAQFTGRRWSRVTTVPDDPAPLDQVSCATTRFCVGIDTYNAHAFNRAGQTARDVLGMRMEPPSRITGVSCVTSTFCVATTGQRLISDGVHVYDGSRWETIPSNQDTFTYLQGVSCASTHFCVAVGEAEVDGVAVVYDGTAWRPSAAPHLTRVACVAATFCLGTGEVEGRAVSSIFNGTDWTTPAAFGDADGTAPVALSCTSTRRCVAVDAAGRAATYRAGRWSAFAAVAQAGPLVGVSCHGRTTCSAVSSTGRVVHRRGSAWSRPQRLRGLTTPRDISCPTARGCVVVDDSGQAVFGRF